MGRDAHALTALFAILCACSDNGSKDDAASAAGRGGDEGGAASGSSGTHGSPGGRSGSGANDAGRSATGTAGNGTIGLVRPPLSPAPKPSASSVNASELSSQPSLKARRPSHQASTKKAAIVVANAIPSETF